MKKSRFLLTAALLGFAFHVPLVQAQTANGYPSKTITIVAPFAPGALTDKLARVIGKHLTDSWGQPVVVENRVGASGAIGTATVAKAPADGYTLLIVTSGHVINPNFSKLPWDPIKDFSPVVFLTGIPNIIIVNPAVPAKSVSEFVAFVQKNPGIGYATSGAGGSSHMTTELFKHDSKLNMTHVPYKGGSLAINDVIAGHVKIGMSTVPTAIPFIKSGQIKPIAVSSAKRSAVLPDVPTLVESGYPDVASVEWWGMLAPAGTPLDVRNKLNAEIARIMSLPVVKEDLAQQGVVFEGGSIAEFDTFLRAENSRWSQLIRKASIQRD